MAFKVKETPAYLRAAWAYTKALVGPMDRVDSLCSRGHALLGNWDFCPECRAMKNIEDFERRKRLARAKPARLALYCVSGSSRGEVFLFSEDRVTISCDPLADVVLSPDSLNQRGQYQLLINGKIKLSGGENQHFRLNGQIHQSAHLFDFDEVEILDNNFLVLDLRNLSAGDSHDNN